MKIAPHWYLVDWNIVLFGFGLCGLSKCIGCRLILVRFAKRKGYLKSLSDCFVNLFLRLEALNWAIVLQLI